MSALEARYMRNETLARVVMLDGGGTGLGIQWLLCFIGLVCSPCETHVLRLRDLQRRAVVSGYPLIPFICRSKGESQNNAIAAFFSLTNNAPYQNSEFHLVSECPLNGTLPA
jgi:hypothetical protein